MSAPSLYHVTAIAYDADGNRDVLSVVACASGKYEAARIVATRLTSESCGYDQAKIIGVNKSGAQGVYSYGDTLIIGSV